MIATIVLLAITDVIFLGLFAHLHIRQVDLEYEIDREKAAFAQLAERVRQIGQEMKK